MLNNNINYIGIDTSKPVLDVYMSSSGKYIQVANSATGIKELFKQLKSESGEVFLAFEPTGGYERLLKSLCLEHQVSFAQIHAANIRNFAKAKGRWAKTDKIDARIIAEYAESFSVKPQLSLYDENLLHLKSLNQRRQQLLCELNRETNRLEVQQPKVLEASITKHINWLRAEISSIDKELDDYIAEP